MKYRIVIVMLALLNAGCGGSSAPVEPPVLQLPPTISQFSFLMAQNSGLSSDLTLAELDVVLRVVR